MGVSLTICRRDSSGFNRIELREHKDQRAWLYSNRKEKRPDGVYAIRPLKESNSAHGFQIMSATVRLAGMNGITWVL